MAICVVACLGTPEHREIIVPLFAFTPKLDTTMSEGLFPQHDFSSRVELHPFGSDFLLFFIATEIGHYP